MQIASIIKTWTSPFR